MNQVSKPMQIALGATLLLVVVWFFMLRPKPEEAVPPPATPTGQQPPSQSGTGLTDRPNQAQSAVNDANAKNSANADKSAQTGSGSKSGAQSSSGTKSSGQAKPDTKPSAKVKPTKKSSDPSAAIIASAQKGNTEVILFWDPAGSDDRHVLDAVKEINTREGTVKVHTVEVQDVGKYTALTQDVKINIAPTIVILSSELNAWRITGYTDTAEINGLVGAIARNASN